MIEVFDWVREYDSWDDPSSIVTGLSSMLICRHLVRHTNLLRIDWILHKSPLMHVVQQIIEVEYCRRSIYTK